MIDERPSSLLDHHFGAFLAARSGLTADEREFFKQKVSELSAAMAAGHSCLVIDKHEADLLDRSHLVSRSDTTPLILGDNRLYIHRYYQYEQRLDTRLKEMSQAVCQFENHTLLDDLFGAESVDETDLQREAARISVKREFSIISGGPGTGKTSTVLKIIALLLSVYGRSLTIGLAAPTGKAAARLSLSLESGRDSNNLSQIISSVSLEAMTLHRLLGVKKYSPSFRHNQSNPLGYDVVIVDEASMVDLALMAKLIDGLKQGSRLILLGDKDQLASVEAGSILADLIGGLPANTTTLTKSYRFDGGISKLAKLVNNGKAEDGWSLLNSSEYQDVTVKNGLSVQDLGRRYEGYMKQAVLPGGEDSCHLLFRQLNQFQLLCAVRQGRRGVRSVNSGVERYLSEKGYNCTKSEFYPGRPVLISQNDYSLNLFNGDIGICLNDRDGNIKVWFEQHDGTVKSFLPHRLPRCETAFALSIHKSQGSEFDEVIIILPENDSPVLSRELVYTAVTRAKKRVTLMAAKDIFTLAVQRRIVRNSGLKELLEECP